MLYLLKGLVNKSPTGKFKNNSLNNQFEISVTQKTNIKAISDSKEILKLIPLYTYDFLRIKSILKKEPKSIVNVFGVILSVGHFRITSQGAHVRNVTIFDRSKYTVMISLWGEPVNIFYFEHS